MADRAAALHHRALARAVTCQDVSCAGDTLANSAYQIDRDNCLEVSASSVGKMSLPLIGMHICERLFQEEDAEEEVDTDGHQGFGPWGWRSWRRRELSW